MKLKYKIYQDMLPNLESRAPQEDDAAFTLHVSIRILLILHYKVIEKEKSMKQK